ncbi:SpoIIE family protein phosphatase [Vibrio campbellii]|uniref:SpoIIE family protein phosphatase n=1 Tax=Vibrio campbellii TaxID=680 RepID=UPI0002ADEB2F|nr:SpoIIE family protein phosphatase [Vibrio campbellii]ARV74604.1 response regulator [Vibrio campbellii CAIM 519 = NBRC 15631 = ATCC 25920]ELU52190.1 response regulator receiver [Vibrio campbellii CAIM 519 = NBRC 15631 = ATCC 25920]
MKSILLVDDSKTVLLYTTSALQKQGYEVIAVEDGESALEVLNHRTDIQFVLSDLMMPGISGIELCRELKSSAFSRYIFFVLLSSYNDQESIIKGMDAGADDFVDKRTSVAELQARIRAGFRTLELHNTLTTKNQELDLAYQTIQQDLDSAGELMGQLLPVEEQIHTAQFSFTYVPCTKIGGDMLGYVELDESHVAFYVFDVSGHGISSALMAFSIQQALLQRNKLESITLDWSDNEYRISKPVAVIERLNRRYQQTQNGKLYFTIEYAVLNTKTGELNYCTAGHPKFVWQQTKQNRLELVGDNNFIVGALEPMIYQGGRIQLKPDDALWFFSDGLLEAKQGEELYGIDRLLANIERSKAMPEKAQTNAVLKQVQNWQGKPELDDDVSLLKVRWLGSAQSQAVYSPRVVFQKSYQASLEVSRQASLELVEFLQQHSVSSHAMQALELCVVELMNNAFIHAYQEQAGKTVELECEVLRGEKTKVELRVADYGNGIDDDTFKGHIFKQIEAPNLLDEDSWLPSGRGLILIAQMTDVFSVSHQGERNCFTVVVTLDERQSL